MSAWRRSMYLTRKMLEHPNPPYNLRDTGEAAGAAEAAEAVGEEAAAAVAVEAALRFGGGVAVAVEAAGDGAIE